MARPRPPSSAAARSPTWSAPTSSARGCSGRSTAARSSSRPSELRGLPRFADWRQINAEALVSGTVAGGEEGGELEVEFRLWDVFAGVQMRGLRFATTTDNWRRVAHQIADAVYQRITGEGAYFDTRIVYVSESGPATDRVKRLAIMDQDGANHRFLTDGGDLVLTPRFHPDARRIAFMAYRGPVPQVYLLDLDQRARAEARRLRRHDLRAAVQPRRPAGRDVARRARQFRHLHPRSRDPRCSGG